ncbi:MAG TPA: DUF3320 domain-containing protein [Thermoanaerobaculia bacterium]
MNGVSEARFDAKYAVWKERLLDLTASNRLLNFRETKVSTVQITTPDPAALFDAIVTRERSLRFPLYRGRTVIAEGEEEIPANEYRVTPGDIETKKMPPDLERSLYRLTSIARTYREERGINTLYIAVGMLLWRPADSASSQKAPLVLVPVELSRQDRMHPYVLQPFDEDPEINPTLIYMLRRDFEYALPTLPEELAAEGLSAFFNEVEEAVSRRGWIVERSAWLGQFHFRKLAMYRDLEEHAAVASENDHLAAVALGRERDGTLEGPSEDSLDDISPAEVFTALDADASQTQVIVRARDGEDLLVQGPPGTGKSQTIANLIAQFLLDGKKVLFVSEKMAALNVVHERLRECGLGTFCLELHSDKANKRDTLVRIGRAAEHDAVPFPAAERQFQDLLRLRRELNAYVRALHQPVLGGRTAYDIHGILAALDAAPDVPADFGFDAAALSEQQEAELLERVARVSRFAAIFDDPTPHIFIGVRADRWSIQLQAEVAMALRALASALTAEGAEAASAAALLRLPTPRTLTEAIALNGTLDLIARSPAPPRQWFHDSDLDVLHAAARELAQSAAEYREHVDRLRDGFDESFPRLDAHALLADLSLDAAFLPTNEPTDVRCAACGQLNRIPSLRAGQRAACGNCKESLPAAAVCQDLVLSAFEASAPTLAAQFRDLALTIDRLLSLSAQVAITLGEAAPTDTAGIRHCIDLASAMGRVEKTQPEWFERSAVTELRTEVSECERQHQRAIALRRQIDHEYSERLWTLPIAKYHDALLTRFHGKLRWLRPTYRRLVREVRSALNVDRALSYTDIVVIIQRSSKLISIQQWFAAREARHTSTLGSLYRGYETDWKALDDRLTAMATLHDRHADVLLRPVVRTQLATGTNALSGPTSELERLLDEYTTRTSNPDLRRLFTTMTPALPDLRTRCSAQLDPLERFISAAAIVRTKMQNPASTSLARGMEALTELAAAQAIKAQFARDDAHNQSIFGAFYNGLNTDFSAIDRALGWTVRFRKECGNDDFLVGAATTQSVIDQIARAHAKHSEHVRICNVALTRLRDYFGDETITALRDETFAGASDWANVRAQRIGELGGWLQFAEVMAECSESGLRRFVDAARTAGIRADDLERALHKSISIRQLDAIYGALPPLRRFNAADHENLVNRFRQLDTALMEVHRRRVQAAVTSRRPDLNRASAGQSRFLRRELAKQRRHAPLRKLFQEAGHIILDITPCLLMSPLSVATYLCKDAVDFDVAIFDEASQMPIEDAVGTICRARQLIVAGDTKQMPPSRFFERSLDDGVEDNSSEQPLESILEDCEAAGMESRPLRWHYRSKHESLIAFSNAQFYDNRLITFPSPSVTAPRGLGVRFEYVADGVYDRGASRTNRLEARRVAQLIQTHITIHPDQSLGVIALSTAQAQAIDEEVQSLLSSRPDLDTKLRTSERDPFFVKALENVQGDERDAMIISIGYAKDVNGKLALQFGPVSTDGGERRLNVAFTRARCQMIVVSSIRGGEINVANVQRRGPKVLRRYLEYAEHGVLPDEMTSAMAEPESPFEESVRQVLRDNGYEVDCQVGVSRYRIDLAVRHPNEPGHYLVGIECDGAAYHSSRVARDRDRLRQTILEQRRWKIYRVWSTDWIRNRRSTIDRLLNHLHDLLERGTSGATADLALDEDDGHDLSLEADDVSTYRFESQPMAATNATAYERAIAEYAEATLPNRHRETLYNDDAPALRELIIAVVEKEAPIHEDILVVRVARAHGIQRAKRIVREKILNGLAHVVRGGRVVRKGAFLWSSAPRSVTPRRPAEGQMLRPIEHVAPEEIAAAAMLVVQSSGGITQVDLARETPRVLGYQRNGDKIEQTVTRVIDDLVSSGRLSPRGSFLVAP